MASRLTLLGLGVKAGVPRRGFVAEVLVLPLDGRFNGFRARCHDITGSGLYLSTSRSLAVDSLVVLKISVGKQPLLELTAQVIHSLPGNGLGCRFLDVDEPSQRTLSLLVAALRAAPPHMRTISSSAARRREASDAITRPRWRVPSVA